MTRTGGGSAGPACEEVIGSMRHSRVRGMALAAASALMFGFSPILCKMVFQNGGNPLTVTCMRSLLALPPLFAVLRVRRVSLRLTLTELRDILLLGLPGVTLTAVLLSSSYVYIPSGLATTLHFIYPALTALAGRIFFSERLGPKSVAALVAITAGIALFSWNTAALQPLGIALALLSGVTYTFYILYLAHSALQGMDTWKLTFYCCIVMALSTGLWGLLTGGLALSMNGTAWAFSALNALCASIGGVALFQWGIKLAGPATASMMSALEPATSVVFGVLLLGDTMHLPELSGCAAVCAGILLLIPKKAAAADGDVPVGGDGPSGPAQLCHTDDSG